MGRVWRNLKHLRIVKLSREIIFHGFVGNIYMFFGYFSFIVWFFNSVKNPYRCLLLILVISNFNGTIGLQFIQF